MLKPANGGMMAAAQKPHPLTDIGDAFDAVHRRAVKRRVILSPAA
ncbi:MAG TPA: hypothetical protein VN795_07585 [Stellaceae bacterium]|jgi:hypothetical protein|nr:hypothetical protein [Stellaceae bacterium]